MTRNLHALMIYIWVELTSRVALGCLCLSVEVLVPLKCNLLHMLFTFTLSQPFLSLVTLVLGYQQLYSYDSWVCHCPLLVLFLPPLTHLIFPVLNPPQLPGV